NQLIKLYINKNFGIIKMRKIATNLNLYLLLFLVIVSSCSDDIFKSDQAIRELEQITTQERSEVAKSQIQASEFTRWDAPWWEMGDEEMADSLRATDG
ncbi:MAG: hypothetical protein ACFCU6_11850, partial [Balneolaceae bacterium]